MKATIDTSRAWVLVALFLMPLVTVPISQIADFSERHREARRRCQIVGAPELRDFDALMTAVRARSVVSQKSLLANSRAAQISSVVWLATDDTAEAVPLRPRTGCPGDSQRTCRASR